MLKLRCAWGTACALAVVLTWASPVQANGPLAQREQARFAREAAGVRLHRELDGRISRVYGRAFAGGESALDAAESFRINHSRIFGVEPHELRLGGVLPEGRVEQPIMFDPATDAYKFTGVSYSQFKQGLPVVGGRMMVLVRNQPGFPIVMVSSTLRDLSDFQPQLGGIAGAGFAPALRLAMKYMGAGTRISMPDLVVWAGTDETPAPPAVAWRFTADNGLDGPVADQRLLIVDAVSGRELHQESLILRAVANGTVEGLATEGLGADICGPESPMPMPYLRVSSGADSTYTDAQGAFTLSTPAAPGQPVTLDAAVRGQFFRIFNMAEPDSQLQLTVVPPALAAFLFNPDNVEFPRAEVNAYIHCNIVRDYILQFNPDYPGAATQVEYPVHVNYSGECDGGWSSSTMSIGIARASVPESRNDCPNEAHSTLVYHEVGHQLVNWGGSGQGQYGEGMCDAIAVLVSDQPLFSIGHFGDCDEAARSAENDRQYPCCCEPHFCGQILSGSVWDTRNELLKTNPSTYREIISALTINSILVHLGTSLTPAITIDFLTLDDDNGDLADGTPHYHEIATGFGNHNMDAPPLTYLEFQFPEGLPEFVDPAGGTALDFTIQGELGALQLGSVQFLVDTGAGFAMATVNPIDADSFMAEFPASTCGEYVRYYFIAQTTDGLAVSEPATAPAEALEALSASGATATLFADDMETGFGGWTTVMLPPIFGGFWNLAAPLGTTFEGQPAAPGEDSSPAPGDKCWITQQGSGGGPDQADVDGGPVHLISPVIDLDGQDAMVQVDVWFLSSGAGTPAADFLDIAFSSDGGGSWVLAESIPGTDGQWQTLQIFVAEVVAPSSQFRVRFSTQDATSGPGVSVVEAGVDEFKVLRFECPPSDPADLNGDGLVNGIDLALLLGEWTGATTYAPCPPIAAADLNGDCKINGFDLAILLAAWG